MGTRDVCGVQAYVQAKCSDTQDTMNKEKDIFKKELTFKGRHKTRKYRYSGFLVSKGNNGPLQNANYFLSGDWLSRYLLIFSCSHLVFKDV